jgi:hypothetical protein
VKVQAALSMLAFNILEAVNAFGVKRLTPAGGEAHGTFCGPRHLDIAESWHSLLGVDLLSRQP